MRAASAQSLEQTRHVIETASVADYLRVADEFFGVSDLLARESSLVRALTSPSRAAQDKVQLAQEVFSTLDTTVVAALKVLAGGRWSAAADIIEACQDLGIEALMCGARNEGALARVEQEIFEVAEFLADNRQVRTALADVRMADATDRVGLARRLFAERLHPTTMMLLERVVRTVEHGRIHSALLHVGHRASRAMSMQMVIVEAATRPDPQQLERLRNLLEARYRTRVTINVRVVPALIGGMRIHVGADVIEGSLATSMDQTRRVMVGSHR